MKSMQLSWRVRADHKKVSERFYFLPPLLLLCACCLQKEWKREKSSNNNVYCQPTDLQCIWLFCARAVCVCVCLRALLAYLCTLTFPLALLFYLFIYLPMCACTYSLHVRGAVSLLFILLSSHDSRPENILNAHDPSIAVSLQECNRFSFISILLPLTWNLQSTRPHTAIWPL